MTQGRPASLKQNDDRFELDPGWVLREKTVKFVKRRTTMIK